MELGFDEDNPQPDTGATPGEIQGEAALAGGSNDRPSRYTGRLLVSGWVGGHPPLVPGRKLHSHKL